MNGLLFVAISALWYCGADSNANDTGVVTETEVTVVEEGSEDSSGKVTVR